MVKEIDIKKWEKSIHEESKVKRGSYGRSGDKALENWERKFLEETLVDELDLIIFHLQTYGCLRLGESLQCNKSWLELPLDESHRDKLIIRIPKNQINLYYKYKNSQSKKTWTCKTKKEREIIIFNSKSVQMLKMFLNKYYYGLSEFFPNTRKSKSVERAIQRRVESWLPKLQEEWRRKLKQSGLDLSAEEIEERVLKNREKISPHCLRATGENYLIKELKLDPYDVANMTGHTDIIQTKNYRNSKDILDTINVENK